MPDLGTFSLTGLGSGVQLYGPMVGLACIIAFGHVLPSLMKAQSSWTETTRKRLKATYAYFAASALVWCGTAIALWKLGLVGKGQGVPMIAMVLNIFAVYKTFSLDYTANLVAKACYFFGSCALQGVVLAQILHFLALAGKLHIAVQAMALMASIVVAVSLFVMACPNMLFLWLGGPLAAGLGLMIGANIIQLFFRTQSVLHYGMAYFGAALFSLFLLYDTSKMIREAKLEPEIHERLTTPQRPFDPINHALILYTDMVQVFMYLLRIFLESEARSSSGSGSDQGGGNRNDRGRTAPRMGLRPPPPPGGGGFRFGLR